MQWMVIWMHPYGHKTHGGGLSWLNQGNNWVRILPLYVKGEARNPFRLDYTSILYLYKLFKHLLMQWMAIGMHPYGHQTHGGGLSWLNQGNNWVQILPLYVKGEARNPFRLNYTSILYI